MRTRRLALLAVGSVLGWTACCPTAPAQQPATRPNLLPLDPVLPPDDPSALKWDDVCRIRLVEGRVVVTTGLTPDALRLAGVDRFGPHPIEINGLPGTTTLSVNTRRFLLRNTRTDDNGQRVTAMVYVTPAQLSLESTASGTRSMGVLLMQAGAAPTRRDLRPGETRLNVYGEGVVGADGAEQINLSAPDFDTLRHRYPHEVNRYLRPLLRHLQYNLLDVDPDVARQVLAADLPATRPSGNDADATDPDPATAAEVRKHVSQLSSRAYARRDEAAAALEAMGPPALEALRELDRSTLTPQQNLAIDNLLKGGRAVILSAADVRRMRSDRHFLVDCLYAPDAPVVTAAAKRLSELCGRDVEKRKGGEVLTDLSAPWEKRADAIEKLRSEVAPAGG